MAKPKKNAETVATVTETAAYVPASDYVPNLGQETPTLAEIADDMEEDTDGDDSEDDSEDDGAETGVMTPLSADGTKKVRKAQGKRYEDASKIKTLPQAEARINQVESMLDRLLTPEGWQKPAMGVGYLGQLYAQRNKLDEMRTQRGETAEIALESIARRVGGAKAVDTIAQSMTKEQRQAAIAALMAMDA